MKKAIYQRLLTARRGSSAVEFAVIAPVMILFTFGLIEISRLMLVKQTITHATREGARVAVRPMGSLGEVTQIIQDELLVQGIGDRDRSNESRVSRARFRSHCACERGDQ